jgi:hypothetical protein
MARGWESKSVEDQAEQSQQRESPAAPAHDEEDAAAHADRLRQRMALELQRERILDERTSNPIRRRALEAALADIESKLAAL